MNGIWSLIVTCSLVILIITNPDIAFNSFISGGEQAIQLSIKLWAIYAVWLGVLKIVEDTKLDEKINKLLNPLITFLFKNLDEPTRKQVAINISSNIFGMGNASTPSGIKAIEGMDGKKGYKVATTNMIMLIVLNTANIQIIPSTIIGMRILHNSINPSDIILPTIITSAISLVVGVSLAKIFAKIFKEKPNSDSCKSKNIFEKSPSSYRLNLPQNSTTFLNKNLCKKSPCKETRKNNFLNTKSSKRTRENSQKNRLQKTDR